MRLMLVTFLMAFGMVGCAKSYQVETGLPADVAPRFFFHIEKEAQERGLRTSRSDSGLHIYAQAGQLLYRIDGPDIVVSVVIPTKSSANSNYYRQKKRELQSLHASLSDGARKRSRQTQDFY